jgi:EmrB/QacA subfamily drug resistance transporter
MPHLKGSLTCDQVGIPVTSGNAPRSRRDAWILIATILGTSLAFIDGTAVNVALPALQIGMHATVSDVQWVVESYSLLLAALLIVGGSLGDLYGRRRVFVSGVILFALASACCGYAPSIGWLILARGVQGVGAALLVPGSLALISSSFSVNERGRAIGTWSGFTAITATVGPVLGGWLVQHASWRFVFFINLPLAAAVVFITLWQVPESRNPEIGGTLDWPGALLATLGLGALTFALIEGPRQGAAAAVVGVIGILAIVAFFIVEARSSSPMAPLVLFRSRNFSGANLLTFLLYGAFGGFLFFFPLNLIQVQHYSATGAGAALVPLILLIFLLSRWSGGLTARYGARLPLTIGPLIATSGFLLLLMPGTAFGYWKTIFPGVVGLGLGMAVSVAPLTTAVMSAVSEDQAGIASGINNAVSRTAGLLAVAVFGLILYGTFNRSLDNGLGRLSLSPVELQYLNEQRPRLAAMESNDARVNDAVAQAFISGYRAILLVAAGLSVASSLTAAFLLDPAKTRKSNRPARSF